MQRCPIRIGLAVACLLLAATGPGCQSLGLSREDDSSDPPAFYDEFFGEDDTPDVATTTTPGEAPPSRLFKRNRIPGGLSPEAREIERGSFNIY